MKVVCTSDIHMNEPTLPDGDVLVIAGDISGIGTVGQILWFARLAVKWQCRYEEILLVPGNHDFLFQRDPGLVQQLLPMCRILVDKPIEIDGKRFYGSPWTPEFCRWAFMLEREDLKEVWKQLPEGLDMLITHGPPLNILDLCPGGNVGDVELAEAVVRTKPRYHVFGHIHEGYGRHETEDTVYLNVSYCDGKYRPVNPPAVVEL